MNAIGTILFERFAHGDEEHRKWLRAECDKLGAGLEQQQKNERTVYIKLLNAWQNLLARIDRDGGHAQTDIIEEDLARADKKVVMLLSAYDRAAIGLPPRQPIEQSAAVAISDLREENQLLNMELHQKGHLLRYAMTVLHLLEDETTLTPFDQAMIEDVLYEEAAQDEDWPPK